MLLLALEVPLINFSLAPLPKQWASWRGTIAANEVFDLGCEKAGRCIWAATESPTSGDAFHKTGAL
jgi:hypothetical protein